MFSDVKQVMLLVKLKGRKVSSTDLKSISNKGFNYYSMTFCFLWE